MLFFTLLNHYWTHQVPESSYISSLKFPQQGVKRFYSRLKTALTEDNSVPVPGLGMVGLGAPGPSQAHSHKHGHMFLPPIQEPINYEDYLISCSCMPDRVCAGGDKSSLPVMIQLNTCTAQLDCLKESKNKEFPESPALIQTSKVTVCFVTIL